LDLGGGPVGDGASCARAAARVRANRAEAVKAVNRMTH